MKYYVYTHSLNGEIFYAGKGSGARASRLTRRSERWNQIVRDKSGDVQVNIVARFHDEIEAYDFEKKLIELYKSIGLCRANESLGTKITDQTKEKLSEKKKGRRNGMYGKTGGKSPFAKPMVAIFSDGRRIETASRQEMANLMRREYNISMGTIQNIIKTGRPYNPYLKQNKELKGLIIEYSEPHLHKKQPPLYNGGSRKIKRSGCC
ncbi:hypothetical protein QFZ28_000162 [Neobacillus niacini]|uniref:NUMOD3 domain-containing DNA-binding protein n=1 Tax=Neobacillus niacini TaxID=86668 RepID=UPI0027879678|nr:NUMOD3 domain-containing DNA-binding protein [Neobacillus niacini]MDQ0999762.1 hypothetical protein [Neobacillus niacini]